MLRSRSLCKQKKNILPGLCEQLILLITTTLISPRLVLLPLYVLVLDNTVAGRYIKPCFLPLTATFSSHKHTSSWRH
jgi:hypothetical protein